MKICIPVKPRAIGGPSIFVKRLKEGLIEHGVRVAHDIDDKCDLLLIISTYDSFLNRKLREKKSKGMKIVQVLMGYILLQQASFYIQFIILA